MTSLALKGMKVLRARLSDMVLLSKPTERLGVKLRRPRNGRANPITQDLLTSPSPDGEFRQWPTAHAQQRVVLPQSRLGAAPANLL